MPDDPDELPSYEVRMTEPAEVEIEKAYLSRMKFGVRSADEWYAGLGRALERLPYLPRGYPLAPESDALEGEVRQMVYGKGGAAYRVLYRVIEPETPGEAGIVRILHVRHAMRQSPTNGGDGEDGRAEPGDNRSPFYSPSRSNVTPSRPTRKPDERASFPVTSNSSRLSPALSLASPSDTAPVGATAGA